MLVIQTTRGILADLGRLPALSRFGLVVMAMAGSLDVAVHLALGPMAGAHHHIGPEHAAHLLGIAGMALVLAGIVIVGARRSFDRTGGARDAHR